MSEGERVPKKNLSNTYAFHIEMATKSGEDFAGDFVVHRPTIRERIRIGVIEAQELVGLNNIDVITSGLAHWVATFDVVVDKAPVWWKPREMYDMEVLQAVYQKYIDYLREFQELPGTESA